MKTMAANVFLGLAALTLAACGAPATNTSTDANAAKTTAAAPTADALLALEQQANEAYLKADSIFFEGRLSDKFILQEGGQRMDRAAALKMIGGVKCDVRSWNLDEPHLAKIDADTYAFSYRGTWDGTCAGPDGKSMQIPSPARAATVWIRNGDKWQAAFHGVNVIVDLKNPSAPPAKPEANTAEPRKDDQAAMSSIAGSNTAVAPAQATGDANTDALVKVELALWEAWGAKDAKRIEDLTAKDISFVNIFGTYFATKADAMKDWTEGTCEVKSVSVTDGVASALSPTVEMLTLTGTADGACGGQKIVGAVYGTTVYVKDGDAWKWAFGMNMPSM